MKRMLSLAGVAGLMFIVGFTAIGCGGDSPSKVVKKFYAALLEGDAKKIGELSTPETVQSLVPFLEKAKGMAAAYGEIVSMEEKIDGDKATVSVKYKNGEDEEYDLVKVDGKWKISISANSGK